MILYLLIIILILYLIIGCKDNKINEHFSDTISIFEEDTKTEAEPEPDTKPDTKTDTKTEPKPEPKTEPKPEPKTEKTSDSIDEISINNKRSEKTRSSDKNIIIKKTNKYYLIYKKQGFYVWEPIPIDNYFPLGQIITSDNKKPKTLSVLVKFNIENKPIDYTLSAMIDKQYGVWIPKGVNDHVRFMSYLVSKNKPSSNRIQGVHKKFTEETQLEELIKETTIIINKNKIKTKFWRIHNSPYFTTNEKVTHYHLPVLNIKPNNPLSVRPTKKYSKIWMNKKNNKIISVWRPEPEKDYRILGDIIMNNNTDPNNIIETPTIHKSNCKNVLYYNPKPLCYKTKDTDVCFWKPKTHDGYTSMGDIITTDKTEPPSDIISSVPLEYVEENKNIINNWSNDNINLWSNNYNVFASTKYMKPSGITYKLSDMYLDYERDSSDKESNILLEFIPKNLEQLDLSDKISTTLSNKLDIEKNRIQINSIDKINNKINLNIKEKRQNSIEETTEKVIKELVDIIYKNNIKVHDRTQIILIINNLSVNEEKETIPLDNTLFNDFVNKP